VAAGEGWISSAFLPKLKEQFRMSRSTLIRTTIFIDKSGQVVRLPEPVAFHEGVHQVEIVRIGRSRLISPAGERWDAFFDGPRASDDFMAERRQPMARPLHKP
jgi:antitoxin VapB